MGNNPQNDDKLVYDELRQLLLGPELKKLDQLSKRLDNPEKLSSDVAEVLPQAMLKSAQQGEQLSQAMVPTVEEIVRLSIKRDINKFASALFPVIGPAIRKSISETIRQMLQSLNQILEHGLSWRGLRWRIESIRTGIPFAQIVLLHSLEYRVEQVFLIHKKTGILLNHIELEDSLTQNADMVSSMLTAIGDFVGDSFDIKDRQELDSIQVGEFSILIEKAPDAILAAAVRGNAPASLRNTMQIALENIQSQFDHEIDNFKGDTEPFIASHEHLSSCMIESRKEPVKNKLSLKARLIWIVALIVFMYWVISNIYLSMQQHDYVKLLEQEPGIIITQVDYDKHLSIKGLRDPLAREAEKFIAYTTLNPEKVSLHLTPYQSLNKVFVEKRVLKILNPPENVTTQLSTGVLTIKGYASQNTVNNLNLMAPLIAGINRVDSSELNSSIDLSALNTPESINLMLNIDSGILLSQGSAHSDWIEFARQKATSINGVRHYDDSQVTSLFDLSVFAPPKSVTLKLLNKVLVISGQADSDWIDSVQSAIKNHQNINAIDTQHLKNSDNIQLTKNIELLEKLILFFDVAESYNFDANESFTQAANLVSKISKLSKKLSKPLKIIIRGHSDSIGNFEDNVYLSLERADYVAQYIYLSGVSPKYIVIKGLESKVQKEKNEVEERYNRRVTFTVKFDNLEQSYD